MILFCLGGGPPPGVIDRSTKEVVRFLANHTGLILTDFVGVLVVHTLPEPIPRLQACLAWVQLSFRRFSFQHPLNLFSLELSCLAVLTQDVFARAVYVRSTHAVCRAG
jgi:hypothetical protein